MIDGFAERYHQTCLPGDRASRRKCRLLRFSRSPRSGPFARSQLRV